MVQPTGSLRLEDLMDLSADEYGHVDERISSSGSSFDQGSSRNTGFPVPPSQFNPLDEPSPLGLRLNKTPSLVDLIQLQITQRCTASNLLPVGQNVHYNNQNVHYNNVNSIAISCPNDKIKASNFPALSLRIGSWEYVSEYDGDLVVKCYFAKHKLIWEVLECGLKSKIEIKWSDITALKAGCLDNGRGTLTIVHFLQCSPGVLHKHFEKLIQCDVHLSILSRQPTIVMDSPYFDSQASGFENLVESKSVDKLPPAAVEGSSPSVLGVLVSGPAASPSSFNFGENILATQCISNDIPSPISVMDAQLSEGRLNVDEPDYLFSKIWEPLTESKLCSSVPTAGPVNRIEINFPEPMTSTNLPSWGASECQSILENISQVLLSDTTTQCAAGIDERLLLKKVKSFCSLLQDPAITSCAQTEESQCGALEQLGSSCIDFPDYLQSW